VLGGAFRDVMSYYYCGKAHDPLMWRIDSLTLVRMLEVQKQNQEAMLRAFSNGQSRICLHNENNNLKRKILRRNLRRDQGRAAPLRGGHEGGHCYKRSS
jgi:hypothetical protein